MEERTMPAAAPMMPSEISWIPLEMIAAHPENPRLFAASDEDDPGLVELAVSIRTVGVLQPVLVRKVVPGYQLIAGERRWRAAALAGLDVIPAIVRDLDDQAAIEILATENLQREDLHPLEESLGLQALLNHGWTLQDVAERNGRSLSWAARRARLANLSPEWRRGIANTKLSLREWPAGHLELIAILEQPIQDTLLIRFRELRGIPYLGQVAYAFAELTHLIAQAPWRKDDAALFPEAGACTECHKRSGCHPGLFDEAGDVAPCKGSDRCLDAACWNEKKSRHVLARVSSEREKYGSRLVLVEGENGYQEAWAIRKALGTEEIEAEWAVSKVKKGTEGARPALIVTGTRAGQIEWVRADRSDSLRTESGNRQAGAERKSLAEKRAGLERRRKAKAVDAIRAGIFYPGDVVPNDLDVVAIVAALGTEHRRNSSQWDPGHFATTPVGEEPERFATPQDVWPLVSRYMHDRTAARDAIWREVLPVIGSRLAYQGTQTNIDKLWADAVEVSKLLGIDYEAHLAAAVEAIPEPKSWARQAAEECGEMDGEGEAEEGEWDGDAKEGEEF